MDFEKIRSYNRRAWKVAVSRGSEWTVPVSPEQVEAARRGEWTRFHIFFRRRTFGSLAK